MSRGARTSARLRRESHHIKRAVRRNYRGEIVMRRIFGTTYHAAIGILLVVLGSAPAAAAEFTDAQKAEIERIVGEYIAKNPEFIADYLRENPEILIEVSEILRARQIALEEEAKAFALSAYRDQIERHPMTPVSGNAKGDVTLVEFFDYNCGYCKRVFSYIPGLIKEDPNLRVVWKEFPILGPVSRYAATAAMAADRQGKYSEFHNAVMGGGRLVSQDQVLAIAERIGLDMERLRQDMADPAIEAYLDETIELAGALGINGTPGFVVGGQVIAGAVSKEAMLQAIDLARKNGG
ncbi:MAG: DsbA family protein [Rhodospirillales bacterium]|nr:MAG: DsbA family protein [Rhodospirillales bacterium]